MSDQQNTPMNENESAPQQGGGNTRMSCDDIINLLNGKIAEKLNEGFDFELSDVLGALQVMVLHCQEQILVPYRANLSRNLQASQAAQMAEFAKAQEAQAAASDGIRLG